MSDEASRSARVPALEWIAGAAGLLGLLTLLGVIAADAIAGSSQDPAAVIVEQRGVARAGSGYVVAFEASNASGGTAAQIEIEGQLLRGAEVVETSTATLDYIAARGKAEGGLFYRHDPRAYTLRLRPLGYQKP